MAGTKQKLEGPAAKSVAKSVAKFRAAAVSPGARRCREKFLGCYPGGFQDARFHAWERDYKWQAHQQWHEALGRKVFRELLEAGEHAEIAARALRIEARSNLLYAFEKMALRDAVKAPEGARIFAEALYDWLYGSGGLKKRFERWIEAIDRLPRRQTRVLSWPVVTVFGFIAQPQVHCLLKPTVTRAAARAYGFELAYSSRPSWTVYAGLLEFADEVWTDLRALGPRDLIDIQSFLWVQGSREYEA